jgi:hypothetical protein
MVSEKVPEAASTYFYEGRIQAVNVTEWENLFGTKIQDYRQGIVQGSAIAKNLDSLDFYRNKGLKDLAQQAIYQAHYDFVINLVENIKTVPIEGGRINYLILYTGTGLKRK